jgi:catechol 2,3-dioxygenase-like lactoylglutathione lyase family enzyme
VQAPFIGNLLALWQLYQCKWMRRVLPTGGDMTEERSKLAQVTPILRVKEIEVSLAYYTEKLGFTMDWRANDFLSVSRGKCHLFLTADAQGHFGTWIWVAAEDTERLYAEWTASGAILRQGPTNFPWGSLEIQVADPDGNVLRFGSDGKEDMPMGPWMDAEGKLWPMAPWR